MGIKTFLKKTSRKIRRHQGQFLAIPLLRVYENSEEDLDIKITTCSCLLNIPILLFSMQPLTESLHKVPKDAVQPNGSLLLKENLMQLCWTCVKPNTEDQKRTKRKSSRSIFIYSATARPMMTRFPLVI